MVEMTTGSSPEYSGGHVEGPNRNRHPLPAVESVGLSLDRKIPLTAFLIPISHILQCLVDRRHDDDHPDQCDHLNRLLNASKKAPALSDRCYGTVRDFAVEFWAGAIDTDGGWSFLLPQEDLMGPPGRVNAEKFLSCRQWMGS